MREYRKRILYLVHRFDAVGAVPPQLWRHAVEACTEELITGSRELHCTYAGWAEEDGW